ncbi:MAG: cytochrome c oxidase assembly protein [Propioniciclava sp.]
MSTPAASRTAQWPTKTQWPTNGALVAITGAIGLAAAFVVWVGLDLGTRPPLPARIQALPITAPLSLIGDLAARIAAWLTLGALAGALLERSRPAGQLSPGAVSLARMAGRAGQVWLWASAFNTITNPAYVHGVPMGAVMTPGSWWTFLWATPSMLAWAVAALVAAGISIACYRIQTRAALALGLVTGVGSWIFVVVTGNVTIGLNHDWATDAAAVATLALVPTIALALGVWLRGLQPDSDDLDQGAAISSDAPTATEAPIATEAPAATQARVRLYQRVLPPVIVLALAGQVVVSWQQLAGQAPTSQPYGWVSLGTLGALLALLLSWAARLIGRATQRPTRWLRWLTVDLVLIIALLALQAAENHIPSPRFLEPQNTEINYLGYIVDLPPSLARLLTWGRPNLLWVVIVVAAISAYVIGVLRVRARGGTWPVGRLLSWLLSWLLVAYLATSGLWEYSTVMYSWHMVVHMTVNMLVPVLAVLGAPSALVRAATQEAALPTSLGSLILTINSHRGWQLLTSPPVAWVTYVGSLFAVYFTPVFPWLMKYHWAHQLMLVFFMMTGYFFFTLIVGVDQPTWQVPHLIKLALIISIMPFHAIFAVGILSSQSLIGGSFYQALDIGWMTDLLADQNIAGQATWILGEVPLFIVLVALAFQWFRSDSSDAARIDAAVDAGDDSIDAYNDMLTELARRDAAEQQAAALRKARP